MHLKNKQNFIFSLLLIFFSSQLFAASPVIMLEKAANNVLTSLTTNKQKVKNNRGYVNSLVDRYIIPQVDVSGMSRSVLGRDTWRKASEQQRNNFSHTFTRLVVRTYSRALRDYSGEKVTFLPIRGGYQGKRFVKISSFIVRTNGQKIPITYSLINKKGHWKVNINAFS